MDRSPRITNPRIRYHDCHCSEAAIEVESLFLIASGPAAGPELEITRRGDAVADSTNAFIYSARVSENRPANDYTPRIVPYHLAAFVPMKARKSCGSARGPGDSPLYGQ
jgi:hypothetical protein